MITRSVTVAKIRREYWQQIAAGGNRFELRDEEAGAGSQAFVFVDAKTGEHLGNARILACTIFGGYDASPWSWSMLSKLVEAPVSELKELFPYADRLGAAASSECEMYVYEITPISDEELLRDILADVPKKRLN